MWQFVAGMVAGAFLAFGFASVKGYVEYRKSVFMPDNGGKICYAEDGFAYWLNEHGFFRAPIMDNDQPDFKKHEALDAMNVPFDELPKLMTIMSHLE